ncbi:hypothetical protein [Clostridium aminobutyricum]|uniref:Uncharacterized protein n=1 Tax=Clostridium aminobutyricum TaxID=33953 RepID=A0A939DAJ2_CLOAM|nr:hypothetical protein [Clostridium aminobutyricum]MBN7774257.1 hypothetical protein [Clostridium aminobutyricum]
MICKHQRESVPSWQLNIIFRFTNIWREVAIYTRFYLVSIHSGMGDHQVIYDRLSKIPIEFGNSFRLFFGDDIANEYTDLLKLQILLVKNLIDSQVRGDTRAVNQNIKLIYDVADRRAVLLAQVNPFWVQREIQSLIYSYLSLIMEETITFLIKDYARSIDIFDRLLSYSTVIGDYYAQGLYNYIMSNQTQAE